VLGPLLFLIYINDTDDGVSSRVLKFADDTKLFRSVATQEEVGKLQDDLRNLCEWSKEWLLLFNIDKCKVMHIGYNNRNEKYEMDGIALQKVLEERDLGVIMESDLTCARQCAKVVGTANRILGMIKRSFCYKTSEVILKLYKSLVRPHLEYCIQAWRLHLCKDITLLEKVQHRVTRMIPGLSGMSYNDRLQRLGLTTLETRRLRGDLIEVHKILKGVEYVDYSKFVQFSVTELRRHSLKLFKKGLRLNCRKYVFSQRVIDAWNSLDQDIVACLQFRSFFLF